MLMLVPILAVIGADSKELDNLCNENFFKTGAVVESANINSNSQIVVCESQRLCKSMLKN